MNPVSEFAVPAHGFLSVNRQFVSRALLLSLAIVVLSVMLVPAAHAGTVASPGFDDMFTFLSNLIAGSLGRIIAVLALIVGLVSLLAARGGFGLINILLVAFGASFGVAIITGIVTATV